MPLAALSALHMFQLVAIMFDNGVQAPVFEPLRSFGERWSVPRIEERISINSKECFTSFGSSDILIGQPPRFFPQPSRQMNYFTLYWGFTHCIFFHFTIPRIFVFLLLGRRDIPIIFFFVPLHFLLLRHTRFLSGDPPRPFSPPPSPIRVAAGKLWRDGQEDVVGSLHSPHHQTPPAHNPLSLDPPLARRVRPQNRRIVPEEPLTVTPLLFVQMYSDPYSDCAQTLSSGREQTIVKVWEWLMPQWCHLSFFLHCSADPLGRRMIQRCHLGRRCFRVRDRWEETDGKKIWVTVWDEHPCRTVWCFFSCLQMFTGAPNNPFFGAKLRLIFDSSQWLIHLCSDSQRWACP